MTVECPCGEIFEVDVEGSCPNCGEFWQAVEGESDHDIT